METFEMNVFQKFILNGDRAMMLSKESIATLSDLIDNKLTTMMVNDRDDLREMIALKRARAELIDTDAAAAGVLQNFSAVPTRGRRRKLTESERV